MMMNSFLHNFKSLSMDHTKCFSTAFFLVSLINWVEETILALLEEFVLSPIEALHFLCASIG